MELGNREVINVKLGDIIKGNVAVPSYEARCIENQGLKALEIVIGSDSTYLMICAEDEGWFIKV